MLKSHYFKTKLIKMGKWAVLPGDSETWHGEQTSKYFKKLFGIPKGALALHTLKDGYEHMYFPKSYFGLLFSQIDRIKKTGYKNLEKKLKTFYPLKQKALLIVSKNKASPEKLSNKQLAKLFSKIRDMVHQISVFDQFGWIAEEYWTPKMEHILAQKMGLKKGSEAYNEALFSLTKPEEISTTLLEKKATLEQAIKIRKNFSTILKASQNLAKNFGWMPVFVYGEPWEPNHYADELKQLTKRPLNALLEGYKTLEEYKVIRRHEINTLVKKFNLDKKDLQIFIDFSLALDTRNEAEYFVSFAGFYLQPLYQEIAKRLYLSVKQLRYMTEKELLNSITGKIDAHKTVTAHGKYVGWGYDEKMQKRINFSAKETEKIFKYVESYVKPIQGGNQSLGICASPGKAKGKIRIVPYPEQNNKVQDGDILVTYATTVNYLPAMKRAAAIITEVGGLTCHAAVVSREFGIPCIVALANAMKNFKDGEMVEVDANKGIVTKIK